jgi:hypothetical protein
MINVDKESIHDQCTKSTVVDNQRRFETQINGDDK